MAEREPVPERVGRVSGKVPRWLSGNLYRNGSGVFRVGEQKLQHLFDGFAVIHRYVIHDGDVTFQSRILDSDTWVNSCKANRLVSSQFVTGAEPDPGKSLFGRVMSYLIPLNPDEMTDNTCMTIVPHGGRLLAMTDNSIVTEVHPHTLQRKAKVDMRQRVSIHLLAAHPHFDADGTMYSLGTSFNPTSAYGIVAIPPAKQPESEAEKTEGDEDELLKTASLLSTVPSRLKLHISYGHSFGMSSEYFVLLEHSLTMNLVKVMTMNWRREGFSSCFVRFPEEKMLFHVIRRSDNQRLPVTFETDPGFCFHFVNCHEVEEHLVVDLCVYDTDVDVIDDMYLHNMMTSGGHDVTKLPPATFRRFVLPINVTEADPEVNLVSMAGVKATGHMVTPGVIHCSPDYITDEKIHMDLPRINYEQCNGKKYRYAYGISSQADGQKLVKVNLEKRKAKYWKETGFNPGEPVFVPRPGAKEEDDGVVLSSVLSELPNAPSFLLVLDARNFKELARATAPCDVTVPMSFHGAFVPDQK
ncbi:hypothetical protein ACOMHN_036301 [Nucella lapillus]